MKRIIGRFIGVSAVVCFVAAALFPEPFRYAIDFFAFPWAHSLRGEPTLTGRWRGQVQFAGRANRELTLEIERNKLVSLRKWIGDRNSIHGSFTGRAEMPDETGNLIRYELWGSANRSGSEVSIKFSPLSARPSPKSQLMIQEMNGSWKGTKLELNGKYAMILYDGLGFRPDVGQPNPPVVALLSRQ